MIWACPICRLPLQVRTEGGSCAANHQFDRAKQGYLPLLPAHHRRSAAPGDDKAMLEGRREFLKAGYYQPLADLVAEQLCARSPSSAPLTLLDSGCGEGYYLQCLIERAKHRGVRLEAYGLDISKEAAKLSAKLLNDRSRSSESAAAESDQGASIVVASSFQLPVLDRCVDVLLRIFSPGDLDEVARVLKDNGEFWRVVPGPRHLFQLKQALYDEVKLHEIPTTPDGFDALESISLGFEIKLNSEAAIEQLLQMTPFVWHGSEAGKTALRQSSALNVSAEFVLQRYRKALL